MQALKWVSLAVLITMLLSCKSVNANNREYIVEEIGLSTKIVGYETVKYSGVTSRLSSTATLSKMSDVYNVSIDGGEDVVFTSKKESFDYAIKVIEATLDSLVKLHEQRCWKIISNN